MKINIYLREIKIKIYFKLYLIFTKVGHTFIVIYIEKQNKNFDSISRGLVNCIIFHR